jgi:hypothetical protein
MPRVGLLLTILVKAEQVDAGVVGVSHDPEAGVSLDETGCVRSGTRSHTAGVGTTISGGSYVRPRQYVLDTFQN